MSGTNTASDRSASGDRIPEKRGFKPRSIPDIRVKEVRGERVQEAKEPAGELQSEVSEPPAFRRDGARPPRPPTPVWKRKPVFHTADNSGQSRRSKIAGSLKRFPAWVALLALLGITALALLFGAIFSLGERHGRIATIRELEEAKAAAAPSDRKREEIRSRLDKALALTRSGDAEGGWRSIRGISGSYSGVQSLAYAEALLALQAGHNSEALDLTKISISRGERVADSLALQAAINAVTPASSGIVQQDLLWKASDADPMNPYPLIELAMIFSAHGDDARAESLIQSAKERLLPVDSHAIVDASLGILKLKHLSPDGLPPASEPTGLAEKDFPTAYAAMRRGDFQKAAAILETAQKTVPPEVFDYLLKASPIRDFALEPKITKFY